MVQTGCSTPTWPSQYLIGSSENVGWWSGPSICSTANIQYSTAWSNTNQISFPDHHQSLLILIPLISVSRLKRFCTSAQKPDNKFQNKCTLHILAVTTQLILLYYWYCSQCSHASEFVAKSIAGVSMFCHFGVACGATGEEYSHRIIRFGGTALQMVDDSEVLQHVNITTLSKEKQFFWLHQPFTYSADL